MLEGEESRLLLVNTAQLRIIIKEIVAEIQSETKAEALAQAKGEMLTVNEVMQKMHVSRPTLHRWKKAGYLIPTSIGGRTYYNSNDLEALIKS